ncbi:tumor necrosis factor receptor superfamily member 8-like isoform X1 [Oncorhynchus keta]|uniref:tumor necrosis factor receptor superfamily member 8-like isoform X1 n=1 Tax=Oncorhynchus keta TaxID=8018 RepID=UPI0015F87D81|nr:tumor necrosis factor receptor superfamily member 8-like isoform X1 [Oncorhynchus keta]
MDYQRRITSYHLRILCFFNLVCSVLLSSCPRNCDPGFIINKCKCIPCPDGYYWYKLNGRPKCDFCTEACSVDRHLTQVKECRRDSNRECHCDRGFFCASTAQYTCRRCKPCVSGTFSNTANLATSCKPHTVCGHKGMTMVTEGTASQDRVCAQTSPTSPTTTALPPAQSSKMSLRSAISSGVGTNIELLIARSASRLVWSPEDVLIRSSLSQARRDPSISLPTKLTTRRKPCKVDSDTSPAESASAPPLTTKDNDSPHLPVPASGQGPPSLPLLLLIVGLLGVTLLLIGYFVGCRGRSLDSMHKWKGPMFRKYICKESLRGSYKAWECPPCPAALQTASYKQAKLPPERIPHLEAQHLLGRETGGDPRREGTGSQPPGGMQNVSVDPSGGENMSNIVGSIYIYSPGTVVLGSNKSDREVDQGESGGESCPLTSKPQQESSYPLPWGSTLGPERMSTPKDTCKELSYPVPATSN